jgi:hypothetical protein
LRYLDKAGNAVNLVIDRFPLHGGDATLVTFSEALVSIRKGMGHCCRQVGNITIQRKPELHIIN